jgi:hypothetical protein
MAMIGTALAGGRALGATFGSLTLKAGETRTVDVGATARTMRVCNDFFSAGPVVVTIGGNLPHDLSPGVCAEDIGDRLTIESHAGGPVTVEFQAIRDVGIFEK